MSDIRMTEEQITVCTDRDLLERYKAQLIRYGTELGWIEVYWVQRTRHGHTYRRQYWRHVYPDETGKLITKHVSRDDLRFYQQGVINRRRVELIGSFMV